MLLDRTFHPDEANQAFTVGRLLETGHYAYKPTDHHGPTLYYAAAPLQKAFGHNDTASLDGTLLRCTPLIFAVLSLVFIFLALRRLLSGKIIIPILAVLLVGTAPLFVFFATDFIQEMLLVCFTAMMFWSGVGYWTSRNPLKRPDIKRRLKPGSWALLFGISAGLAFATKETSILTFAAAILAFVPTLLIGARTSRSAEHIPTPGARTSRSAENPISHLVLAFLGFLLTSVILFSSFCENWQGVSNAFVAAPLSYFHRAAGDAVSEGAAWHVHPWWKHLQWLFLGVAPIPRTCGFTIETNAFANLHPLTHLLFLALPISLWAFVRNREGRAPSRPRPAQRPVLPSIFLASALYTLLLLVFYSAIPYKTPWCTLQILVPFLVTAALGYGTIHEITTEFAIRKGQHPASAFWGLALAFLVVLPLVTIATEHIPGIIQMNRDPDSPKIPYNYAHASPEAQQLAACVASAIQSSTAAPAAQDDSINAQPPSRPTDQPTNSAPDLKSTNISETLRASAPPRESTLQTPQSNNQTIAQSNTPTPFIAVALPPADTWPFPWYNRAYEHMTGYWTKFEDLVELEKTGAKPTVVIVPMTEGHLVQPLFPHLKHTKRFYMRPGVRVRVFW